MKKALVLPIVTVLGSLSAFVLRLAQNHTGFDLVSGLALPGNPYARWLMWVLGGTAALIFALVHLLPKSRQRPVQLPQDFTTTQAVMLIPGVAGSFLLILSGAAETASALGAGRGILPGLHLFLGVLTAVSGWNTASMLLSCKPYSHRDQGISGKVLLLFPVVMVVRLVLTYRLSSNNPVLAAYYPQILAQILLTLGFYRLASFAFLAGNDRRYALYAMWALLFCVTALADAPPLSEQLLYLGSAVVLLSFLLLRILHVPEQAADVRTDP